MGWWGSIRDLLAGSRPSPDSGEDAVETLSDMVRGIAHSVSTADEIADEQFLRTLQHYFEKDAAGHLVPKTVAARVSETHDAVIPLVTLLDHSTQRLKETTVRMKVRMTEATVKDALRRADENLRTQRASFRIAHHGIGRDEHAQVIDVEMRFERSEPPEGVGRVLDLLDVLAVERGDPEAQDPTGDDPVVLLDDDPPVS